MTPDPPSPALMLPGPARPPAASTIALSSNELEVLVLPSEGADIYAITDRASGIDVLFKSPWGWRDPALLASSGHDEAGWLDRYAGGWQLLLPNAGPPRIVDGVLRGYHGEAAILPWTVHEQTSQQVKASVFLTSAPLRVVRTVRLEHSELEVRTEVSNLSADPVAVTWVEHPAFGAPFIDERSRLETGARRLLADATDPGELLQPGALSTLSRATTVAGGHLDLRALPGLQTQRKVFAALTDFDPAFYSITSPTAGFGIRLDWDKSVHPHAWLWQECQSSKGFPWFGRAFAVAVEPANVLPGTGSSAGLLRGDPPALPGYSTKVATVLLRRFSAH